MSAEMLQIHVIVPDQWREQKMEFAPDTPVAVLKERALPKLLGTDDIDASTYYVEYFEKEILDESRTLADLGVRQGGVVSLRPYDMDHPPPFNG